MKTKMKRVNVVLSKEPTNIKSKTINVTIVGSPVKEKSIKVKIVKTKK